MGTGRGNEGATRRAVAERCGGCCERCGRWGYSVHHRWKRGQGGPWSGSNCVALCGSGTTGCHGWVESHPDLAEIDGWHVRPWRNPADVPIRLFTGELVWLSD